MRNGNTMSEDGIILEFIAQGSYVKVTAIDTRTGREATIVGDANAGRRTLEKLAIRKLEYVLKKK